MQKEKITTTTTLRFYDLLTQLELRGHQERIRSIQEHKHLFALLEDDLEVLRNREDIYIHPLPEKTYFDNGKVRVTIQICDGMFQKQVCTALIRRGYADTEDSSNEVRIMQRDNIYFIVTTTPQKKTCASSCSHHCKCNSPKVQ